MHIFTCVFDDHAPIKNLSKKEKSLIDKPWINNYLLHLMLVRDTCFIKYCRAKKATEKSKTYVEYKILRNEAKFKTKQAINIYYEYLFEQNKTGVSKTWQVILCIGNVEKKVNALLAPQEITASYFSIQQR